MRRPNVRPVLIMTLAAMASLTTPARVIPNLRARDVQQVVGELTRVAAAAADLDHDMVQQAVLARGQTSSFGFGRGIAVPHALVPGLEKPLGAFARLHPPQDFGAADEVPADVAFLLLSPADDDPTHLRALACVVRRLRDRDVAARLRSAEGAEAIHAVLTSDSWRGIGQDVMPSDVVLASGESDLTNGAMYTRLEPLC